MNVASEMAATPESGPDGRSPPRLAVSRDVAICPNDPGLDGVQCSKGDKRFVGSDRMYTVEIRCDGDGLVEPMEEIRTWLDRKRIQPSLFRLSLVSGATIFRVEFNAARDADAFAQAFAGQVIGGDGTGAVAA